ncbi:MAG: hypothetical protein NTW87_12910 [Planctomycetota bacterium]|nr:hypothetical protein [Planctomycetota bacterium]
MVSAHDRKVLRSLARRVREIAEHPEMPVRKKRWYALNALKPERPLVLCFPEGAWGELLPSSQMQCTDEKLRHWEWTLRSKVYWWKHIRDDNAIEPFFDLNWHVKAGDFGVKVPFTHGENRGSYTWDPPLKDLDRDIGKLHFRELSVHRAATQRDLDLAADLFGDILPPRLRGGFWWSMGLTGQVIWFVGLEQLMLLPYDNPKGLHRLMAWLRDEMLNLILWHEREGLLTHKNECDYVGSGGVAYTDELPQNDWKPGMNVRLQDIWGFAESQETVNWSPAMFAEFVLPYQVPLLKKFGLNCYGCCEGVHLRIDGLFRHVPRLRRVSVAPWADQAVMAAKLDGKCVFSRKPNPALVCVSFDEDVVRKDLRDTLRLAGHLPLELIMKDTHTVENKPKRMTRWVQIALEEAQEFAAGRRQ